MKQYVMGIDHGGSGMKAVIFDLEGNVKASSRRSTSILTPQPGYTERDMEQVWQMHCEVIREAIERADIEAGQLIGLSFSGHGKGLYLWGKDDKPVRPGIVSTDSRAYRIVDEWYARGIPQLAYPKICQSVLASQPVALLRWLMENEPEAIERTKYIFGIKDYVRYRMTGVARSEITDISGSGLLNLRTKSFDMELLALFGVESVMDKLPTPVMSAEFCGTVTPECAALTGLKAGTPVSAGLFDIDACAIGMNVCDDSRIAVIAGTWAINEYITREPVMDGSVKMNSLYCLPGYYLAEECSPTSASNYDWVLNNLMTEAAEQSGCSLYDWANAQVNSVAPDEQNIIFLPYLYGGCDDALSKSVFVGLEAWHTRAHMLRAVCEGIVYGHRKQVARLQCSRAVPAAAVRLAGGVVHSDGWVQMFADILGLPVEIIAVDELGTLGAAMTAAVAAKRFGSLEEAAQAMVHVEKVIQPNLNLKEIYDRKFRRYLKVEASAAALYRALEENE